MSLNSSNKILENDVLVNKKKKIECAINCKEEKFSVLVLENSFELDILESLCIQSLRLSLCEEKIRIAN